MDDRKPPVSRASPSNGDPLPDSKPAIAYLILAHGNPAQLARLVFALPEDSPIYVHFDLRADAATFDNAKALLAVRPAVTFVDRHACRWGNFGVVQGTISLIRAVAAAARPFDYAVLLSGADYPIKSNVEIASFFDRNRGQEFIESFSLLAPNRWSSQGGLFQAPQKVLGLHVQFRSKVWRLPILRKPPMGMHVHGGSQWWGLSSMAIHHIVDFLDRSPNYAPYFAKSFIPDESFIQTILSNSPLANHITGNDLRVTVWDRPAPPYPAVLKMDDLEMLLRSDKLFARKFSPTVDSNVLQALDQRHALAA